MGAQDKSRARFLSRRENDGSHGTLLEFRKRQRPNGRKLSSGECAMEIGRVVGTVVSTVKSSGLKSFKLLVVTPLAMGEELTTANGASTYVAIDLVGVGEGEIVLVTKGSAARVSDAINVPTDAAIVAVVDTVQIGTQNAYSKT